MADRPNFKHPPVVEVVMGVNFSEPSFLVPYFGLYWEKVRNELNNFAIEAPISPSGEPTVQFMSEPDTPRVQFSANEKRNIIQIQKDWFFFNWCKVATNPDYPSYDTHVRPGFERRWQQFRQFVRDEKLSPIEVQQCEITYVNHVTKGNGWNTFADLGKITRLVHPDASAISIPPQSGRCHFNYELPNESGRLSVAIHQAASAGQEVFVLQLTARGRPADSTDSSILAWCDQSHDCIVRAFADITTDQMHELWGRDQ